MDPLRRVLVVWKRFEERLGGGGWRAHLSMNPSMVISSSALFSVASAHTSRQAAFGTIVALDECASSAAARTRRST